MGRHTHGGAVITGILGLLTFPWLLVDGFLSFLPTVGAALAPIAGIMIADYYLIRRRRIEVPALFDARGHYRYWRGVNPASLIAWVVSAAAGIAFIDYSLLIAFPLSLILYYPLMRFWILGRHPQREIPARPSFLATTVRRDWPVYMREEPPDR